MPMHSIRSGAPILDQRLRGEQFLSTELDLLSGEGAEKEGREDPPPKSI